MKTPPYAALLPPSANIQTWHQRLRNEITRHLTPMHASLFAVPVVSTATFAWYADGANARTFASLIESDREHLLAAVGVILSDIRRLAESAAAPAVAACWPALAQIPDLEHVFAVDGRPVLAGWAQPSGPEWRVTLAKIDDRRPWSRPKTVPWATYGTTLATLAAFALAAGVVLPRLSIWIAPPFPSPHCDIAASELATFAEYNAAFEHNAALRQRLSQSLYQSNVKRNQCKSFEQNGEPDLPLAEWSKKDVSVLAGCWELSSSLHMDHTNCGSEKKKRPCQIERIKVLFSKDGTGDQLVVLEKNIEGINYECNGPLHAEFDENGNVTLSEPTACLGDFEKKVEIMTCERASDSKAKCRLIRNAPLTGGQDNLEFELTRCKSP